MNSPEREPDDLDRYLSRLSQDELEQVAAAELAIDLAVVLHRARESRDLSQAAVAELLGSSQQAVSRIERPGSNVTIGTLRKYLDVLGYALEIRVTEPSTGRVVGHVSAVPPKSDAAHARGAAA